MKYNTSTKSNKILKFMIVLMLIISMSAQILLPHITVNAAEDTTGGEGHLAVDVNPNAKGGPNLRWDRCGWLAYVITKGGTRVSKCAILCPTVGGSVTTRSEFEKIVTQSFKQAKGMKDSAGRNYDVYNDALIPRGETTPVVSVPRITVDGLKVPYTRVGGGSGAWAKQWLGTPSGATNPSTGAAVTNGGVILGKLYSHGCISSSLAADMNANKQNYCLVLEAVAASAIYRAPLGMPYSYNPGRAEDDQYAKAVATAYGMAYYCKKVGYQGYAVTDSGGSSICWNNYLPLCAFPNPSWPEFNLEKPKQTTKWVGIDTILKGSYGLVAWRTDNGTTRVTTQIDTYDVPNQPSVPNFCEYPTPGSKSGPCKIVKHYWEGTDNGSGVMTYRKRGMFERSLCSNHIHITDELDKVGYKLVGWWSTHNYNSRFDNPTPMDAVDRRRTSAGYQQGTDEATVTLNTNAGENTLVLEFVKTTGVTKIDTYDIPNQPSVPSYCEYPTPDSKDGTCRIIKHYWNGTDDGSGVITYTKYGMFERSQCSPRIHITDELDKVGYKLVGWWSTHNYNSSLDDPTPMDAVDRRRTSAGYQQGTGENTIRLDPGVGENTLVLEYVKTTRITLANGDYKILQSQIAQRASFDNVTALKTALANHNFRWNRAKHITSCYAHGGYGHTLGCGLSETSLVCGNTTHEHTPSCYHYHNNSCYRNPCTEWNWVDSTVSLGVKNVKSSSYPSVLSNGHQEVHKDGSHTDYIKHNSSYWLRTFNKNSGVIPESNDLYMSNHQYDFVIFRGQDRLTLAKWRNATLSQGSTITNFLTNISSGSYNFASANTKGTRKDTSYVDKFIAKFSNDSLDSSTTYGPSSGTHKCSNDTKTFTLQNATNDMIANVAVEVYWADGVDVDYPCPPNKIAKNNVDKKLKAGSIKYLPYIMMRYDGDNYDDRRVAVLSQFSRTATFYDYAEYEIDEPYDALLSIDIMSNQWSTHRQAVSGIQNFFGNDKAGDYIVNGFASQSILPGGAVFSFGIPSDRVRTVTVKSMQAYLPSGSSGYDQVMATGTNNGLKTDTNILKEKHKDFVDNARAEFEKAVIREYLATNRSLSSSATNSYDIVQSGTGLSPNITIPVLKTDSSTMNNTTNSDTKYYFNNYAESKLDTCYAVERGGSNLSDESYEASTERHTYTFYTNTLGEIRCIIDDVNVNESVVASQKGLLVCKPGSMSILASFRSSSPNGYNIAVMTDVINSLKSATVSQAGADPECPWGKKWYNEAFDGITYMYQETEFKVGIWDPVTRETVLDTAVTPYQESKDKFFTLFHAMALNSWKENDTFGEFTNSAGNSCTLTYDFDKLYGSKIFYIPNVTTQDLN